MDKKNTSELQNKVGGWAGLIFVFLIFGLFLLIFRELKKGNIFMWIYIIAVIIYIRLYGVKGLT
jgi:hypothetical protein